MAEKKKMMISAVLAVFNEERHLERCLSPLRGWIDEIVIVDGGSTDRTVEIARKYTDRIIETDNPPMFHINKQKGLDSARGTWILQLDADEVVSEDLKEEILQVINDRRLRMKDEKDDSLILNHKSLINGYYIPRRNYFWGHFMKKGGQYPDYVIRLVKRGKAKFPCVSVHEQISVDGEVGYLKNPLLHYSYETPKDYWTKADTYTSLTANDLKEKHVPISFASWFYYMVRKPVETFFSIFVRHKGFVDGIYGFTFAYWSALHFPIAYNKYRKML